MQKLVSGVGVLLGLVVLSATAQASVVISKPVAVNQSFNGTSGFREVTFDLSDFPYAPDTTIQDIEVSITFSKLAPAASAALYNEISFTLSSPTLPEVGAALVRSGIPGFDPNGAGYGTFGSGDSFGDPGFNGTLVFRHSATTPVNAGGRSLIPSDGQPYLPDGSFSEFIGKSGVQTFRLTMGDSDDSVNAPLVVDSFTVSIRAVPEPGSLACLSLLATASVLIRRRRA